MYEDWPFRNPRDDCIRYQTSDGVALLVGLVMAEMVWGRSGSMDLSGGAIHRHCCADSGAMRGRRREAGTETE